MAKTIYCTASCSVNLVAYEAGQVLENVDDDLARLLMRAAPTSFTDIDPNAPTSDKTEQHDPEVAALDEPPSDKMIKRPARSK